METVPNEKLPCKEIASHLRDIADETENADEGTFYEGPYMRLDELHYVLRAKGIFRGHFIEH